MLYLRKFIGIDAMHLCGKYPSMLFMTTIVDGNDKIIQVAFAIVGVECEPVWKWFLEHLDGFLTMDLQALSIVLDRHWDSISTVSKVYLIVCHIFYCYHLLCNMIIVTWDRLELSFFWAATRANTIVQ